MCKIAFLDLLGFHILIKQRTEILLELHHHPHVSGQLQLTFRIDLFQQEEANFQAPFSLSHRNKNRYEYNSKSNINNSWIYKWKLISSLVLTKCHTVSFPIGGNGLRSGGSLVSLSAQHRSLLFLLSQITLFINLIARRLWGFDFGNGPTSRVNSLDHSQVL